MGSSNIFAADVILLYDIYAGEYPVVNMYGRTS
jgi:hypothetical protein